MKHREALKKTLADLLAHGYKCYIFEDTNYDFGYIITPNDNVLCIQHEYFGGWSFSFAYIRTREHGTGCPCLEKPVDVVTLETVQQAEWEGFAYACRLKAGFFPSSDAWMKQYRRKESLVPVVSGDAA